MAFRVKNASNKFNAKRSEYNGRWFHSKGEASYAEELDWLKKAGEIKEWIPQCCIDLRVNGVHIANYYVDFKVITKDGTVQFHEYKGFSTELFGIKWNLFHALKDEIEPGCELILIKHKSTYKPKRRK